MGAPRDRAGARKQRRASKSKNHEPLLRLVQEEQRAERKRASSVAVVPLNKAQQLYDIEIQSKDVIFGTGPAGTGKTWFAAMRAGQALLNKEIERIIVTRPALEAGESLGFLPGELEEKYEPYFRPVRDAFEELFGTGPLEFMIKSGKIEARPLGLIRGATIKDAWLIADEMQNATVTQTKLLLSRIGQNAKFIVNGDPDQCDLPGHVKSGLLDAVDRLRNYAWCGSVEFTVDDIVRSDVCRDIIVAYSERHDAGRYSSVSNDDDVGLKRLLKASGE